MDKAPDAYRTISEVADDLDIAQHVLRFWETKFPQIKPLKRGGGRRYYRPDDVELVTGIRYLLYKEGYTIKGVQRILKEQGPRAVMAQAEPAPPPPAPVMATQKPAPVQPAMRPATSAAARPPAPQFHEPDPAPYRQEPIFQAQPVFQPEPMLPQAPVSQPVIAQQRDTLFDLPEMRKASPLARASEEMSAGQQTAHAKPDVTENYTPSSLSQVSMIRGGLTHVSPMPAPQQVVNIPSATFAQSAPIEVERPAPKAFSILANIHEGHSSLADALHELEAIRAALANLLDQRPNSFP